MKPFHILMYEPVAQGHEMQYVRYLLRGIESHVKHPRVTLLTTSDAAAHPNCQSVIRDFPTLVTLRIAPPVTGGNRLLRRLSAFQEYLWKNTEAFELSFLEIGPASVDFVILPLLETIGLLHLALRPGLFRGRPWATIAHNMRYHHRARGIEAPFELADLVQHALFRWVLRNRDLVCFGTNDPWLADIAHHPKIALCPNPAVAPELSPMAEARAAYGIRPETCVILVFGVIDRRKCLDVLLEGIARAIPELDVTLLLAGVQKSDDVGQILRGAAATKLREHGRLIEVNRFIVPGVDIDPMSVADIVWLFYRREFRTISDVLTRAALSGRPVIARNQGVTGRLVEQHQLGLTLSSEAPDDIAAVLTRLARDPALRRKMGDNGLHAFPGNTPENHARPIVEAINQTLRAAAN